MASVDIPPALVRMLAGQRVIPFIGSGFSSPLQLPQWDALLRQITETVQEDSPADEQVSYDEIREACKDDPLQIAEYLFLRAGETIGPLRHAITNAFHAPSTVTESTAHIELVNLNAPHVYTTNYDDLIESCYRALGRPVDVVAIARDVARADPTQAQVVKYHGDLRHEQTLVLTESQYYRRLDFESPMDLKLRADLLGRAVLFIGYSFSDINIRVIWFKLMQTMQEVPEKDRLPSYIVRLRPNPVLDRLYDAVGLTTIVIDPEGTAGDPEGANRCLSEFMLNLTMEVARAAKSPASLPMFVSLGILTAITDELSKSGASVGRVQRVVRRQGRRIVLGRSEQTGAVTPQTASTHLATLLGHLTDRQIPQQLLEKCVAVVDTIAREVSFQSSSGLAAQLASWILGTADVSSGATLMVAAALSREGSRDPLFEAQLPWAKVWAATLDDAAAMYLLNLFESELNGHEEEGYEDDDVAYCAEVVKRIADGSIVGEESPARTRATELLVRLAAIYPAVDEEPPNEIPIPTALLAEVQEVLTRRATEAEAEEAEEAEEARREEQEEERREEERAEERQEQERAERLAEERES